MIKTRNMVSNQSQGEHRGVPHPRWREKLNETQLAMNRIKGIMHSLNPNNYDPLKDQLVQSLSTYPNNIQGFLTLVFEKVVQMPKFWLMYGRLCSDLIKQLPPFALNEAEINFRWQLVEKCQREFGCSVPGPRHAIPTISLLHFFGELLKQKLPIETVIHRIVQELLKPNAGKTCPSEENVEAICQLLTSVGKRLDETLASRRFNDTHFSKLMFMITRGQIVPRLRVIVHNVLDLRANKWTPRGQEEENCNLIYQDNQATVEAEKLKDIAEEDQAACSSAEKATDAIQQEENCNLIYQDNQATVEAEKLKDIAEEDQAACSSAEKATDAIQQEPKGRKKIEALLAKEKEEHEKTKQQLNIHKTEHELANQLHKKEQDSLKLARGHAVTIAEEIHVKWRKETEALAIEKQEHKKTKILFEVCKNEHRNLQVSYEERLAREKIKVQNATRLLEVYKNSRDDMRGERDDALKLVREVREETLLSRLGGLLEKMCQPIEKKMPSRELDSDEDPPSYFICPISQEIMKDPRIAADGFTYEEEALRQWFSRGHNTSPMTNLRLPNSVLIPNLALRSAIQEWVQQQV